MFVILSEAKDLKSKDGVKSDHMFEMFRFAQHDTVRWWFSFQIPIYLATYFENKKDDPDCVRVTVGVERDKR